MNPGPVKYPCGIYLAAVKQRHPSVCCDHCSKWIHNCCSGFSVHIYDQMKETSGSWICPSYVCHLSQVPYLSHHLSSSVQTPSLRSVRWPRTIVVPLTFRLLLLPSQYTEQIEESEMQKPGENKGPLHQRK